MIKTQSSTENTHLKIIVFFEDDTDTVSLNVDKNNKIKQIEHPSTKKELFIFPSN